MSDASVPTPDPAEPVAAEQVTGGAAIERVPATVDPVVDPSTPAGVPHGTQVVSAHSGFTERIVHDVEEVTGHLLGWHKEHIAGGEPPAEAAPPAEEATA